MGFSAIFETFQISLDNVTTVGQRLDDKQLWVTFKSDPNGMVVDLSLKCKCVAELVKTLKAALQLNLDWGEELTSDYTSTVVCHKRSHTSVGKRRFSHVHALCTPLIRNLHIEFRLASLLAQIQKHAVNPASYRQTQFQIIDICCR